MKTKKQKVEWLIKNTKNLTDKQQTYWENLLNMALIFSPEYLTHNLLDEYIMYAKNNDGECFLKQFPESLIHLADSE